MRKQAKEKCRQTAQREVMREKLKTACFHLQVANYSEAASSIVRDAEGVFVTTAEEHMCDLFTKCARQQPVCFASYTAERND